MQSLLLLLKSAQFGYFVCLIRCTIHDYVAQNHQCVPKISVNLHLECSHFAIQPLGGAAEKFTRGAQCYSLSGMHQSRLCLVS